MIKIENVDVYGWESAIRGMRNPKNSWEESDSFFCPGDIAGEYNCVGCRAYSPDFHCCELPEKMDIGLKDYRLMQTLADAGTDHGKYLRMITVYADIVAPLYWWKEYDTYKVGTVANSCSTMHKLTYKEFELEDFSTDQMDPHSVDVLRFVISALNANKWSYDRTNHKHDWYQIIQLLPSSYNQRRTVMLNYQVLKNMHHARKNHKLDEWRAFCKWIETLPYSELITGEKK